MEAGGGTPGGTPKLGPSSAASDGTHEDRSLEKEEPTRRVKRKIVPKQVPLSNWTAPRRPFQSIASGAPAGLLPHPLQKAPGRLLNMDDGDTSEMLTDSSATTASGLPARRTEPHLRSPSPAPPTAPSSRENSAHATLPLPAQKKARTPPTAAAKRSAVEKPALPPPQAVTKISIDHLRAVSQMSEEDVNRNEIPLTFWSNCKHVLGQYNEWCGCGTDAVSSSAALRSHEDKLITMIETSLVKSAKLSRLRKRREAALLQLSVGEASSDNFSPSIEGSKFQELRLQIHEIEERKKILEGAIHARARSLDEKTAEDCKTACADKTTWCEPEYVQDGADRLELQVLRKEQAETAKALERLEGERAAATRAALLYKTEDSSAYAGFPLLNDRYLMLELIGYGGYSEVWKAFDRTGGQELALKVHELSEQWSDERKATYIKHARRETDIQKKLCHPNIVRLVDCFEIGRSSFATVMEYSPREDLGSYLHKHGTLREKDARIILRQILLALDYISDRKIIHYDLKPANVLFFGDLSIKLIDFGLAKIMDSDRHDIELTSHGAGTLWYLPSECFGSASGDGQLRITPKVDVYSAGVVLYQMLYAKKPFYNDMSQRAVMREKEMENAGGPRKTLQLPSQPKVSDFSQRLLKKMLAFDAKDRPTVAEILQGFAEEDEANEQPENAADGGGDAAAARAKKRRVVSPTDDAASRK